MSYREHKEKSPRSVGCAVLTISDSRTEEDDESGRLIKQKLSENGHRIMSYAILKNEPAALKKKLQELLGEQGLQVIITSGGTGASRRDITIETISTLLEKTLDGFGENPPGRACRLMAEIEDAERGDAAAARQWLLRAAVADPGPVWLCESCGAAAADWRAVCSHCGTFDGLAWSVPRQALALTPPPAAADPRS